MSRLILGIVAVLSSGLTARTSDHPVPVAPHPAYFGVNVHPLQYHYDTYPPATVLQLAKEIGASVVRIDIHWEWTEYLRPGKASWYAPEIRELDAFLAEAARRHIRVLATVVDTPCWASSEPGKQCPPAAPHYHGRYPPARPQDFARFLTLLVRHVGRKIQYYEIWNEPNLPRFWANPDPVAYTRLLRAAYFAIKAVDPAAEVLAGATSRSDVSFVRRMYDAGAGRYFDALSVHPYSGNRPPDSCAPLEGSFRCGVERIHHVMLAHGDNRPLWLTEFGKSVSSRARPSTQAVYLRQAISLIRRWRYIGGAVWYELYDDPSGHDGQHFGLFQGSLCPRPAAFVFRSSVLATKHGAVALRCRQSSVVGSDSSVGATVPSPR